MHIKTFAALAVAIFAASAMPAFAQKAGETIDVGGWKVSRTVKPDGSFKTCTATMLYDDKSIVGFAGSTLAQTYIVAIEPDFKLTEGQTYAAKFHVDDDKPTAAEAIAADATTLVFPIDNPAKVFTAIQKGNTLTIDAGGNSIDEPLGGSNDALAALAKCIQAATS